MKAENPKGIILPNWMEVVSAPLEKDDIKWKVQTVHKDGKYQMYVCYFDKRTTIDRLNLAFGGHWSAKYTVAREQHKGKEHNVVECTIRIEFATHCIERSAACEAADIEPVKSSRSNSLKLAGGMFGIGSELYEFPKVLVAANKKGNYTNNQCSVQALSKALDAVRDIHLNSNMSYDFLWIDAKGDIYEADPQYRSQGSLVQSMSKTKKVVKKTTKKVAKETTVSTGPTILDFPTFNVNVDKPEGGKDFALAIRCWNGKIVTSKPDDKGNTFEYVALKGYTAVDKTSYHKLTKNQAELLKARKEYVK